MIMAEQVTFHEMMMRSQHH